MRLLICIALLSLIAVSAFAQMADTTATAVKQQADTTAAAVKQQADTAAAVIAPAVVAPAVVAPAVAAPAVVAPAAVAPPQTTPPPATTAPASQPGPKKVYYGGTLGLSFGDYTRISITPLIGYKLKPFLHIGGKATYEYIEDSRYADKMTSSSYGGSIFTRAMPQRNIYFHAEYAYINYEYNVSELETDRYWVPFLYLGGGLVKPIGKSASAYVEVLFDVLQDDKSPYEDWSPLISAGVGVGF
jgi:type II secretory pathway pseudopilin PulG